MRCLAFVWVSLLFCIYSINIYINIKCCTLHSEPSLHACGFLPRPAPLLPSQTLFCFLCDLAGEFILAFALWKPTVVICKSCGLEIKIIVHVHLLSCLPAAPEAIRVKKQQKESVYPRAPSSLSNNKWYIERGFFPLWDQKSARRFCESHTTGSLYFQCRRSRQLISGPCEHYGVINFNISRFTSTKHKRSRSSSYRYGWAPLKITELSGISWIEIEPFPPINTGKYI